MSREAIGISQLRVRAPDKNAAVALCARLRDVPRCLDTDRDGNDVVTMLPADLLEEALSVIRDWLCDLRLDDVLVVYGDDELQMRREDVTPA